MPSAIIAYLGVYVKRKMASYEKNNKSGKWSVRFRLDEGGRLKNMRLSGYPTKKAAQTAYVEFMANYIPPNKPLTDDKDPTFAEMAEEYLRLGKQRWKSSSYYDIKKKIDNLILPFFGNTRMRQLSPATILEWQETVAQYSYKYKASLRTQVNAICKYAYKYHDIPNVSVKADGFRRIEPRKEMQVYTPEQFAEFCAAADDDLMRILFRTLYVSGCRKGELAALTWDDIDPVKSTIRINKNVTRKATGKAWEITTPKNHTSNRTIRMPSDLLGDIISLRHDAPGNYFVFGSDRPIPDKRISRALASYADKAGLPRIRVHDFRHSCASYLISCGVSIVAVSKRLGHANIQQTLNTYSHMMPQDEDKIDEALKKI